MPLTERPLAQILVSAEAEAQPTTDSALRAAAISDLAEFLDARELEVLVAIDGYEHSFDCLWQLSTAKSFASTMFSDELGPSAPYLIVAWTSSGDAWALDQRDAKVVFLNHDGWDTEGEHAMVVPLGISLLTFIALIDVWASVEELLDTEENDPVGEVLILNEFRAYLEQISSVHADRWPYC